MGERMVDAVQSADAMPPRCYDAVPLRSNHIAITYTVVRWRAVAPTVPVMSCRFQLQQRRVLATPEASLGDADFDDSDLGSGRPLVWQPAVLADGDSCLRVCRAEVIRLTPNTAYVFRVQRATSGRWSRPSDELVTHALRAQWPRPRPVILCDQQFLRGCVFACQVDRSLEGEEQSGAEECARRRDADERRSGSVAARGGAGSYVAAVSHEGTPSSIAGTPLDVGEILEVCNMKTRVLMFGSARPVAAWSVAAWPVAAWLVAAWHALIVRLAYVLITH